MTVLLINTVAEPTQVALADGDRITAEATVARHGAVSEHLLERIDDLLKRAGIVGKDLAALGIVTGPGSFTGLRIGVAVTNALARSFRLPIVTARTDEAPSLGALAKVIGQRLTAGQTADSVLPEYGKPPTITPPARKTGSDRPQKR